MTISGLTGVLETLMPFVYGILIVAVLIQWKRRPEPASGWLAASFCTLGLAIIMGRFLPEGSTDPAVVWARKSTVAILVLFPYCLYRFMTSFIRPMRWVWIAAPILTAAVASGALLLPSFPQSGEPRPAWFEVYLVALLSQWGFLTGLVAVRLWPAGRGHPAVARRRMRTLSVGAVGLATALVLAGEASSDSPWVAAIVQSLAIIAAPLMFVGFAPPRLLRMAWRRPEQAALRDARLSLMKGSSADEVTRTLLRYACGILGGEAAVLRDSKGEVVAIDGSDTEHSLAISGSLETVHGDSAADRSSSFLRIPMDSGQLIVAASPLMPFFGEDEIDRLEEIVALADLALGRANLIQVQRRFAAVVESTEDAIIAKSLEGIIESWNDGATSIYGYEADEVIGRSISLLVPRGLEDDVERILEKIRKGESLKDHETKRQTKDGRIIDVSLTISPIWAGSGEVDGASVIGRDITDIKRAADALRGSEERTRTIIDTAKDAYIEIDSGSLITEWNAAATQMFGIQRADALGKDLSELIIPARYRQRHRAGMATYLETGKGKVVNTTTELSALRGGTDEFPVELTVWPVHHGSKVTFHAFVKDITERNAAHAAIAAAREEADRANLAKSEFLSRMSHELRTPLNAVLGFAQLLDMDLHTPEQKESTGEIIKAGQHLLELIDEVLDISRIEAGKLRLSLEPVDAAEVIEECISLLMPLAAREGVSLSAHPPTIPDGSTFVAADRQRLKQVVLNLVSNGIKYNRQHGSVRVSLQPSDQDRIQIDVADTGPGIAPDRRGRLFSPFERLGAEGSGVQGTGLGLSLSKSLVEAMGGSISVATDPGRGSTFTVTLPKSEGHSQMRTQDSGPPEEELAMSASSRARTIVYIEDNLSNLKLVQRLIARRPDLTILPAMQGGMGVILVRDHEPDLILLDLDLPDIPGEEVLLRLQSDPGTARIPIVIISADATAGQIDKLLDAGASAYLTKPIEVSRFYEVLERFCAET